MSNRPIKFRVWDIKEKSFQSQGTELSSLLFLEYQGAIKSNHPDFIFQQFTGLEDENGKEIYEGDLVNFHIRGCPHGPEREDYENREVWYCPDSAAFLFDKYYYDGWHGYPAWDIKGIEVVGNIFENPEKTKEPAKPR